MGDLEKWMKESGYMREGGFLVGIELWAGEYHGKQEDPVYVSAPFMQPGDHGTIKALIDAAKGPIPVRRVSIQMKLKDFFALFKRLSLAFSRGDLLKPGVEYVYVDG